jgi:hypothetical protein
MKDFEGYVRRTMGSTATSTVVPQDYLDKVIGMTTSVILTDDYSPVDNLIAPVFNERFGYKRE